MAHPPSNPLAGDNHRRYFRDPYVPDIRLSDVGHDMINGGMPTFNVFREKGDPLVHRDGYSP